MKRVGFAFLLFVLLLACQSFGQTGTEISKGKSVPPKDQQIKFKDMPDDHWAASAVYDLVRMGVTKGYPDGTFRGKKNISRYETALFLSKLASAIDSEDLKAEIKSLRDEVVALKKSPLTIVPLSGSCLLDWKFGNILSAGGSSRGVAPNYRLNVWSSHQLADNAAVNVHMDTMDYGYLDSGVPSSGEVLATKMIDVESKLSMDMSGIGFSKSVELTASFGPGYVQHNTDPTGFLPSEVGITYIRPKTGVCAATNLLGLDLLGGYLAADQSVSGKINISQVTGKVGVLVDNLPLFKGVRLETTGDYFSSGLYSATERDLRATVSLATPAAQKLEAEGKVGVGGRGTPNMMVAGSVRLNDLWETGTVTKINFSKIGSEFINANPIFSIAELGQAGFDSFNRPLLNGTVNLGGEILQKVTEDVSLVGRGDIRLDGAYKYIAPMGRLTAEGGIYYAIAPNALADAVYRVHQDKATGDTSDLAAFGLMYKF